MIRSRDSDRVRRFTRTGVAAALGILGYTGGRRDEVRVQVDVDASNFHVPQYDRGDLDAFVEEAAAAHGISAHLVRAVVEAESAFDPFAVSPVGAQGLMQLMPTTAELMGVGDPLDPRQNIFGGVKYLSQLLDRFGGNVALALAGYNAGPTTVARCRGIPPYGETRRYVTRIRSMVAASTGTFFPLPKPVVARKKMRTAALRRTGGGGRPPHRSPAHQRPRRAGRGHRG